MIKNLKDPNANNFEDLLRKAQAEAKQTYHKGQTQRLVTVIDKAIKIYQEAQLSIDNTDSVSTNK